MSAARAGADARAADSAPASLPASMRRRGLLARVERRLPRLTGSALALAFFAGVALAGWSANGGMAAFLAEHGAPRDVAAKALGFGVEAVTITGISRLQEGEVLAAAGISARTSLPFLDATIAREGLEALPLVRSASVRKLFPDRIAVAIVEREPFALWQVDGQVYVVAADGEVIDLFKDDPRYAALPLVVGEGANARLADYLGMIEAAGPLRGRIRAGTLVAERRWTLVLDDGLDVRLPEADPRGALSRLVALEARHGLLAKDIIAVDLRMPGRVVVRLTEEAAAARAESLKDRPLRGRGVRT